MMRQRLAAVAVMLGAVASGWADDVEIRVGRSSLPYSGVTIVDARDGIVKYIAGGGNPVSKPVEKITFLQIRRQTQLNKAEKLFQKKRYAEAVKVYDQALSTARKPWLKRLIRYRRLQAANAAGVIDRGVTEWLSLADASGAAKDVMALKPSKPAAKGDKANLAAIGPLEKKAKTLTAPKDKAYLDAVRELLLALYEREGMDKKAEALSKKMMGAGPGPTNGGKTNGSDGVDPGAGVKSQLKAAQFTLSKGNAKEALAVVLRNMAKYGPGDLPQALLIMGKAHEALAEADKTRRRKRLGQAGLNFMYIVAYFPNAPEAPEALFRAASVSARLGNFAAARKAYHTVTLRYAKSTAVARKAADAMKKIPREK